MKNSVNTFSSLNSDMHPVNTKPNVMTDAINATLTTEGDNQFILQNMKGNEIKATLTRGFQPLGVGVLNDIAYIISGRFNASGDFQEGEIGTFPSPDWAQLNTQNPVDPEYFLPLIDAYQPLYNFSNATLDSVLNDDSAYTEPFKTDKFNFLPGRLIEVELQPSYDDSVNIIFTDDYNKPRLVNSRFKVDDSGKNAALAERRQTKDTNTYANERFSSLDLIRQSYKIPDLSFEGVQPGGSWLGGNYRFYFRYTDTDGSLTDVIEESSLVSIGYNDHGANVDTITNKLIKFKLGNLDKTFSGVKIYYSFSQGDVTPTTTIKEIEKIYEIGVEDFIDISLYGTESTTTVEASNLNLDLSSVRNVKSITQQNDRLIFGNISSNIADYDTFADISSQLKIEENNKIMKIKGLGEGYSNPDNVYANLGYWAGETYEIGIVYILKEGKGLTPVFPLKGGDNYENNFTYSSSTSFGDDGYIQNTSENKHGAYRTNKNRVKLTGGGEDQTEVRYFKVDITSLQNNSFIQKETDGFFFARKERKKDAVVQGYICNAYFEPIQKGIISTDYSGNLFAVNNPASDGTTREKWVESGAVLTSIWDGLGVPHADYLNKVYENTTVEYEEESLVGRVKVLPCPGRALDLLKIFKDKKPVDMTYQGAVNGLEAAPNPDNEFHDVAKFWSFYSADQQVDPQFFASFFNDTAKGLTIDDGGAIQHRVSYPGGTIATEVWDCHTFQQIMDLNSANIPNDFIILLLDPTTSVYTQDQTFSQSFSVDPNNQNLLSGILKLQIYGTEATISGLTVTVDATLNLNITDIYNVTGTLTIPSVPAGSGFDFYIPNPITFNVNSVIDSGLTPNTTNYWQDATHPSTYYFKNILFDTQNIEIITDDVSANSFTNLVDNFVWEGNSWDKQNIITNNNTNYTIEKTAKFVEPLNHSFTPVNLTPAEQVKEGEPYRRNYMQYILSENDGYSNYQFASRADRNLYYGLPSTDTVDVNGTPTVVPGYQDIHFAPDVSPNSSTEFDPEDPKIARHTALWQHNVDFEDYVGLRMSIHEPKLTQALQNDWEGVAFHFYETPTNFDRLQEGIRFAVQANVYRNPHGVITPQEWKIKYGNYSAGDSYIPVTKRYRWDDINITDKIDIFGGDCFLTYFYKRVQRPLGIPGIPTATNWDDYNNYNRAAGLVDNGLIFGMVLECNHNTAMRSTEKYDTAESLLYGRDRSFYPIIEVDDIRTSKQPESQGYNFGYTFTGSDKLQPSLDNTAPSFSLNQGNRIMVSSPSPDTSFENGYRNFRGLNYRDYNKQLGEIHSVISLGPYTYCIFESGIGVVPLNQRTMVSEQTGGVFLDDAVALAQKMQIISSEYGSNQQFSVIKTDNFVYGYDLRKNRIWRITSAGGQHKVDIISDFGVQKILSDFKKKAEENSLPILIKSNYDRERNNVVFSFYNEDKGDWLIDKTQPKDVNYEDWEQDEVASIYWNETLNSWISRLSWNPIWMFNISNKLYSFNALAAQSQQEEIWEHFSENVPYCNFYGSQYKFSFEFIIVDNPSAQKILDNLLLISNRSFPGKVIYRLLENDTDYENYQEADNGYSQLTKQRHEPNPNSKLPNDSYDLWSVTSVGTILNQGNNVYFTMNSSLGEPISQEESERIVGGFVIYNGVYYIIGNSFENNGIFYNEILDQNGINVINGVPAGWTFNEIDFGIIKQNMEYIEDHLYIEVGRDEEKSRVRDKAIKVKIMYEGYNYTTIQSIISTFTYSFG